MFEFEKLTTKSSLQIIRDIAADIWPKTFASILSKEQISYMMQMMYAPSVMEKELDDGFNFEIIKINDRPAGYFSWSKYELPQTAKLHKLYLLEQFHGQGIGSKMLDQVAMRAKNAGFVKLRLNVNKYNAKAIKAYQRNNFVTVESVKIDIGNGFFMYDFVMEKEL
jgi:ribosomal protein S18 acetylase RimI-like enzyme